MSHPSIASLTPATSCSANSVVASQCTSTDSQAVSGAHEHSTPESTTKWTDPWTAFCAEKADKWLGREEFKTNRDIQDSAMKRQRDSLAEMENEARYKRRRAKFLRNPQAILKVARDRDLDDEELEALIDEKLALRNLR